MGGGVKDGGAKDGGLKDGGDGDRGGGETWRLRCVTSFRMC
jgi:hypothetical protein